MTRKLVFDISNVLFRAAAMQKYKGGPFPPSPEELVGLSMHISMQSIAKWYRKFKPDIVIFAFEGGGNWRKSYTAKHALRRQYKANRTPDPEMAHFYTLIDNFKEIMSKHTSIHCLSVPGMEGDDVIAAYCQLNAKAGDEIIIVSGDRDFVQITKLPGVIIINPDDGKQRNTPDDKEYQPDIDYWLFLKCVRGDSGDNVPSAYPRVYEKKIKAAYEDDYAKLNFMNEEWKDETGTMQRVGDLFNHNRVLMDLTAQPDDVRVKLLEGVEQLMRQDALGTYSHFHFIRFLSKFKLNKMAEEASKFIDIFTHNQRFYKGEIQQVEDVVKQPLIETTPKVVSGIVEF